MITRSEPGIATMAVAARIFESAFQADSQLMGTSADEAQLQPRTALSRISRMGLEFRLSDCSFPYATPAIFEEGLT